ncbi:uncharacterized protein LOC128219719 [Mya arenaria]|uniref:uncharacterized protein LOC128219719 n=1 Tax=Mya arenaria TaxID=6604 RepID=UPI0022E8705E|nr:uncharacterized protein LOC128219719 [Mya arenaria]
MAASAGLVPMTKVELRISCRKLKNKDITSKSDPCAVLFMQNGGNWTEVGRTENVQNCLDPDFAKCFTVDYMFELVQKVKISVYDLDNSTPQLGDDDFLGQIECSLGQIVAGRPFLQPLLDKQGKNMGDSKIILTSTPPSESAVGDGETENGKRKNHDNRGTNEMVEFKISGEGVQLMGFHHYEDIWVPHIGEKLRCQYVKNEGIIAFQGGIKRVGSVKKELANLPGLKMLLDNGGRLEAIVQRNDPKDSKRKGMSIVVDYLFSISPDTNLTKEKITNKLNAITAKIKKWKRVNIEVLQNNLTSTPPSESAVGDGETENGKRKNHDNDLESVSRKKPRKALHPLNGPPLQTQHVKLTEGINARLCQCISGDWEVFFIQLGLRKVKIQQLKKERKDEKESVLIFHALEMLRDVRINRDGCYLDDLLMSASKSPKLVDVDWDEIQSQVLPYLKIFCTSSKPVT